VAWGRWPLRDDEEQVEHGPGQLLVPGEHSFDQI